MKNLSGRRWWAIPEGYIPHTAGRHYIRVTLDRSSPHFAEYLREIATHYPHAKTIHLVMDNLSSHTRKAVVQRYGEQEGGWLWGRFYRALYPQTRQLVESGRDRN